VYFQKRPRVNFDKDDQQAKAESLSHLALEY
jgi:hypothetical protein